MRIRLALALLGFCAAAAAHNYDAGELQIRHPWSRATAPGAKVAVGYLEVRNNGQQADRLVWASSELAQRVEMHVTERAGEIMRMRQVKGFDIPARQRFALQPSGAHLMLVDIVRPLKKGERVPLTLRFERAGEVKVELEVQDLGSSHSRH